MVNGRPGSLVEPSSSEFVSFLPLSVVLLTSAPRARAAARPEPSPNPPEAMKGIFRALAAKGNKIKPVTSSSPG